MIAWAAPWALLLALAIDRRWGEPPPRLHPVVWMGHLLHHAGVRVQAASKRCRRAQKLCAFGLGTLAWCAGAALFSGASWALQSALLSLLTPIWLRGAWPAGWACAGTALGVGVLLKPLLAWRMLGDEVRAVEAALAQSLPAGRARLSGLVSRDTLALSAAQVRESAIESLAENLSDAVVAPIFWFVVLGLPGAALYRFANTADAMWGYPGVYQGHDWAWAGKWAARADDVLNWVPARLSGCVLAALAGVRWAALRREARKTPSPNGGWPMAAMALALGVGLAKPGGYALNPGGAEPTTGHTEQALALGQKTLTTLVWLAWAALFLGAFA